MKIPSEDSCTEDLLFADGVEGHTVFYPYEQSFDKILVCTPDNSPLTMWNRCKNMTFVTTYVAVKLRIQWDILYL